MTGEAEQKRLSALRPIFQAAQQLAQEARRLGIRYRIQDQLDAAAAPQATPAFDIGAIAVHGMREWAKSIVQTVEEKVTFTPTLKAQWQDISERMERIYADPDAAASRINLDAVAADPARHQAVLDQLVQQPEMFGELRGKTGLFASKADRQRGNLLEGASLRTEIERYYTPRPRRRGSRRRNRTRGARLDIPALSPAAIGVLERSAMR